MEKLTVTMFGTIVLPVTNIYQSIIAAPTVAVNVAVEACFSVSIAEVSF